MSSVVGERAALARQQAAGRQRRRQRLVAVGLIFLTLIASAIVVVLAAGGGAQRSRPGPSTESVPDGQVELRLMGEAPRTIDLDRARRLAEAGALPFESRRRISVGNLTQTVELNQDKLAERLAGVDSGGTVVLPENTVASRLDVPIIQQAYRNNCETAALSMLLASAGIDQDQLDLQAQITEAKPLDPEIGPGGEQIWGDPNQGFVGRPEGGGPAGGFGVFEQPILDLASRFAKPIDLSRSPPKTIYQRLLAGHAVMTWIGLSDGPYETWTSPAGNEVAVNFGEHTVLLTGIAGNRIYVNDPIDGVKKVWSRADFEAMWELLDQRAVSL